MADTLVGKYFPYGQERPSATQDGKEKFATYFRDSETGLDYAQNRYHQPGMGRFMTPDQYTASSGPKDPASWNRYAYTEGDPVNGVDPSGRYVCGLSWVDDMMFPACTDAPPLDGGPGMGPCPGQVSSGNPGSDLFSCAEGLALLTLIAGEPAAPPPPTCGDVLGASGLLSADPGQIAATKRILNENAFSWVGRSTYVPGDTLENPSGPAYTYGDVYQTDYMVASVLVNRVNLYSTNKYAFGYPNLLAAATGESNPQGGGIYDNALKSPVDSSDCMNLSMAIQGLNQAMASPFANVYWWKGVLQPVRGGGTRLRTFHPDRDIRVGFTDFTVGLAP